MDLVSRVLGIAAAVGNRVGRFSINFIKLNWLLMFGLGAGLFAASNELRYALANGSKPREITVAEAVLHTDVDTNYVRLRGTLIEETVFQHTTGRHGRTTVDASYFALLDAGRQHAVLVRTKGEAHPEPRSGDAWLTGMLMPIDSKLQKELAKSSGRLGNVAFDTDYVLELGRKPGNAAVWGVVSTVLFVAMSAMLTTWRNRYVVFRRSDERIDDAGAPPPTAAADQPPMQTSGVFALGERRQRFTAVPSVVVEAEGTPFVCANIDASSRFMGIQTSDGQGVWMIALPRTEVREVEAGHQYYGLERRSALRIHHTANGKAMTTVISCALPAQRRAIADLLRAGAPAAKA